MYLARDHGEMAGFEAWMTEARAHGLDTRAAIDRSRSMAAMTGASVQWMGGLFTASDARGRAMGGGADAGRWRRCGAGR